MPFHANIVESFLSSPLHMSLSAKLISPSEIILTNNFRHKKSPEHDKITNKIVQNIPKKSILFLTHIYNTVLCLSYFPSTWKN